MKTRLHLRAGVVAALFSITAGFATSTALAHEAHNKETPADTTKAKADYPLSTCVVSGDKLEGGDMGPPIDYTYKQEGKPDRLVRLCCKGCIKDFNKSPEKYLKAIDDAAAAKAKGEKPAEAGAHSEHGDH